MRVLRGDEAVDEVARMLDAAAAEAPDSPRAAVIRAALLRDVALRPEPRPSYRLALAAAVVVAVVLGTVGAPAIGSYVDRLEHPAAGPLVHEPEEATAPAKMLKGAMKEPPAASETPMPSESPAPIAAPSVPAPSAAPVTPQPSASPSPTPRPVDPPVVLPTPPIPIPTPPILPGG